MNKGIAVAGNIIVDKVKIIDEYPDKGMLVNIFTESDSVGGCVCNTAIDLAIIDDTVPIFALGKVGADKEGEYVLSEMRRRGVNVDGVKKDYKLATSYTDVMTVQGSGERTFFHARGANSAFCIEDVNIESLTCDIFHAGYILLLDMMDGHDEIYGTKLARLLCALQKKGIKTSVDCVSEKGNRFKKIALPPLRFCDYAIINEIEAGEIAGINPRDSSGIVVKEKIKQILKFFFDSGVKEKAIIHCPEAGFCLDKSGEFTAVGSLCLPKGFIRGSVGAGDAFCAASLYAIYRGCTDWETLELASAAAACNLSEKDSISGMKGYADIKKMSEKFDRRDI